MTNTNTRQAGNDGEDFACAYIREQGMKILARNFRFGRDEIDIVAKDGDAVVFIEVKARQSTVMGRPEEAVTAAKRRAIIHAATGYLKQNGLLDSRIRFDVAAICGQEIKYIRAAFDGTGALI
ncbi:MAG: YraN family protein [Clostridia bacterium]|nr:YraN family protein [Clostridia bacterium]